MTDNLFEKCPICGEGPMVKREKDEVFSYKGQSKIIPNYPVHECDICGEELVEAADSKRFEKVLTDFRRSVDGLLTSDEIKEIRKSFGYTQKSFAKFLEVGEKNFARYERGAAAQSRSMDHLLRILRECPFTINVIDGKNKQYSMNQREYLGSATLE